MKVIFNEKLGDLLGHFEHRFAQTQIFDILIGEYSNIVIWENKASSSGLVAFQAASTTQTFI